MLDCYCCLFLFENSCYARTNVCSVSHSSKQLWQKLLQSFCAIWNLHLNCSVMILSGNKLKAGRKKSSSTKIEHSRCILLLKVRMCFSQDTLVLTFWVNCGYQTPLPGGYPVAFNWFEFIVKYIKTVLKWCFVFLLSNNVYWYINSGRSPPASMFGFVFLNCSLLLQRWMWLWCGLGGRDGPGAQWPLSCHVNWECTGRL